MDIQQYNNLINEYETNYKNYISHLFNDREQEAETSKQDLIRVNNLLQEQVVNFSNIINQQRGQVEVKEQEILNKKTEYEGLQSLLGNKLNEQTQILENEVKGDKKIKNVNEKLNRKNNMINILIFVNVILGIFLVASIAFVLVLKNRNGSKMVIRNNKNKNNNINSNSNANSNSNKSLSNKNSNNNKNSSKNSNGLSSL